MKLLLIVLFVLFGCNSYAQRDTLQIVFDYLNSNAFRNACRDSIIKNYGINDPSDTSFLNNAHAFVSDKSYFLRESQTAVSKKKFDSIFSNRYYVPIINANDNNVRVIIILQGSSILVIHSYLAMDARITSGITDCFKLTFSQMDSIKLSGYNRVVI